MTKSDLLGWTLAELALALLFAIFAIFTPTIQRLTLRAKGLEQENKRTHELIAENEQLRREEATLRASINASRANLKSKLTPPCSELDKSAGWLFTATVMGPDSFEIGGAPLTLAKIRERYSSDLADAKKKGCMQRIRINFEGTMSAQTYDLAKRRLDTLFYSASLGKR